jgi:hypothetical protein
MARSFNLDQGGLLGVGVAAAFFREKEAVAIPLILGGPSAGLVVGSLLGLSQQERAAECPQCGRSWEIVAGEGHTEDPTKWNHCQGCGLKMSD